MEDLAKLENPVRREFHLFLLLSGSRLGAMKLAGIAQLNFRSRTLHVPRPKGSEGKAFDIPLSRAMIRCLVRVMRLGRMLYPIQSKEWLFPAGSGSGHLTEHKEGRRELAKWGNDLRQTYRTVAQAAGTADLDIHLLVNHGVPGVNAGYITRSKLLNDHLRHQQEAISRVIFDAVRRNGNRLKPVVASWPLVPARTAVKADKYPMYQIVRMPGVGGGAPFSQPSCWRSTSIVIDSLTNAASDEERRFISMS